MDGRVNELIAIHAAYGLNRYCANLTRQTQHTLATKNTRKLQLCFAHFSLPAMRCQLAKDYFSPGTTNGNVNPFWS